MQFDKAAGANPIDQEKAIGQPTPRIEGPLKVTGRAPYAYERRVDGAAAPAYGFVLGAAIAKGKIKSIDLADAQAAPGVLAIITANSQPPLGLGKFNHAPLLAGPDVVHYHQAVALVVADTFEQARYAASLIRVDYADASGAFDLKAARDADGGKPAPVAGGPADTAVGDFERAFAQAQVKLDETYFTPDHSHAMMEPHATIAVWNLDMLTVWTSSQMVEWHRADLARTLGLNENNVRLVSSFVGGGFGSKLFLRADAVLASLAAMKVGRPVKVALARPLIFNNTTHRPATLQRIRLAADAEGKLQAIAHEGWSGNLSGGSTEGAIAQTRLLYAGANRMTANRLLSLDLPEGNSMRAPAAAAWASRRRMVARPRRRRRLPQPHGHEVRGARAVDERRRCRRRDRYDRHRHRQLHDHRADGGGMSGRAAASRLGAARRFRFSRVLRLGRPVRRGQLDLRRLCRVHAVARQDRRKAQPNRQRRRIRRWAGEGGRTDLRVG